TQWEHVLWLRALAGVALSGMPAVTLAYMGEEFEKDSIAPAVGLYIAGGAVGGMSGRLLASFLADYGPDLGPYLSSWRLAMIGIAITGLISTFIFWRALAPSNYFMPREFSPVALTASLLGHMRNAGIVLMVIVGFLMLGAYMALFNYVGFRLQAQPFRLSQSIAGLIFIIYPIGSLGSAHMGALAGRYGRGRMLVASIAITILGTLIMSPDSLLAIGVGLIVLTYGFFGVHSICSGWAPALAERDKAQASSLYLLFYYIGGGVAGSLAGVFWVAHGWMGVAVFSLIAMCIAVVLAALMMRVAATQ
ncbi:MAG: MFS transporter, partial [Alphaproteobacteria bacterium]|nr:MFS transporter [Alphaproteobacteria bacterium]